MNCDDRRDAILLYASGCLEPAERAAVCEHLSTGCPICIGVLVEAQATVAALAANIEPVAPPPAALSKLMTRVSGPASATATPSLKIADAARVPVADHSTVAAPRTTRPSRSRLVVGLITTAAACIALTAAALLYWTRDARSFWGSPDLVAIRLDSPTQPDAHGQLLWDRAQNRGRIVVDHAVKPQAGREYELWIIPPGGKPRRSESFNVNASGDATIVLPIPAGTEPAATFAITDEPLGGLDAPTGKVHFAGSAK